MSAMLRDFPLPPSPPSQAWIEAEWEAGQPEVRIRLATAEAKRRLVLRETLASTPRKHTRKSLEMAQVRRSKVGVPQALCQDWGARKALLPRIRACLQGERAALGIRRGLDGGPAKQGGERQAVVVDEHRGYYQRMVRPAPKFDGSPGMEGRGSVAAWRKDMLLDGEVGREVGSWWAACTLADKGEAYEKATPLPPGDTTAAPEAGAVAGWVGAEGYMVCMGRIGRVLMPKEDPWTLGRLVRHDWRADSVAMDPPTKAGNPSQRSGVCGRGIRREGLFKTLLQVAECCLPPHCAGRISGEEVAAILLRLYAQVWEPGVHMSIYGNNH